MAPVLSVRRRASASLAGQMALGQWAGQRALAWSVEQKVLVW